MARRRDSIDAWREIPRLVHRLVDGLKAEDLKRRSAASGMTIRETVHHIVEANVVAASIVVAALGSPGCVYDWSWMQPFGKWMTNVRHDAKRLEPSLRLLDALNAWVVAQFAPLPDGLGRTVRLREERDGKPRRATVASVLEDEATHAREHLDEVRRVLA